MPLLDVKTLSLIALATSLMLPLVLTAGAQFVSDRSHATRSLIVGSVAYAVGFLLLALRGVVPDWIPFLLGNCLVVGGFAEVAYGMRVYLRGPASRVWMLLLIGASIPSFYWCVIYAPNPSGRVFLSSVLLLPIAVMLMIEFFIATRRLVDFGDQAAGAEKQLLVGLSIIFGLAALSFLWRAYSFWGVNGEIDPSTFGGRAWGLSFLVGILLNIALATSLPLLISRRNQRELLKSRGVLEETERLALVGSLVFNPKSKLVTPNRLMAEWMNAHTSRRITLDDFLAQIDAPIAQVFHQQIGELMTGKLDRWTTECQMASPGGGSARWLSVQCGVGRDASGDPQVIISARDITEFKLAAQRAIDARNDADRANTAKSEFLANMSHEIRTPMNGVLGLTRLCLEGELRPRERDLIEKCHGSAQSLLGIVNDILDFSKIEAGKLTVETVPFHLDQVLDNARNLFEASAGGKGLRFTVEVAEDVPHGLLGDALRLSQVLNNFLSNAVKFTAQGEVHLSIRALSFNAHANSVSLQFSVRDTGIGMTAEQRQRLFKPFSQADSSTTRKYGGSGLGLVISGRLIALMGGKLDLQSKEGVGSTFIATLPFGISNEILARPTIAPTQLHNRLSGVRVLLVEDNPTNVLVATLSLQSEGAIVHHVGDGQQAVDFLRDKAAEIDTVLMDIQMPVMDGYTATRILRNELQLRELPVIAMTANVLESDRKASQDAGMNAHVGKPFDMAQLVSAILQSLGSDVKPIAASSAREVPAATLQQGSSAMVELAPAMQRMGNNHTLLLQAARSFEKDLPGLLAVLRSQAPQAPNAESEIPMALHTLKGLAATLGLAKLSGMAAELEHEVKHDNAISPAQADALAALAAQSVSTLLQQLGSGDPSSAAASQPVERLATGGGIAAPARTAVEQLLGMLEVADMSALALHAEHRAAIAAWQPTQAPMLEEALQALEFEAASQVCKAMLEAK